MLAFGALLTCAAVLALAALIVVLRGPNPPRWLTGYWTQELASVVLVCALAFGPAAIAAGAIRTYEVGPSFIDLGLLGVVVLAAAWIWRQLGVQQRLSTPGARSTPAAASLGPLADSSAVAMRASAAPPTPTEPIPPGPAKPTRRAA